MSDKASVAAVERTGHCKFCRQSGFTQAMEDWDEERVNEQVTLQCQCENAQAYQKAIERKQKAKKRVNELFGEGSEKAGKTKRDRFVTAYRGRNRR